MKVAIYKRKSMEKQDLQTQDQSLKEYCDRQGYEIVGDYEDVISGKTDKRPDFDRMILDMRQGKFQAILCYKLDRIGRSLQHLLNLFEEFDNLKVEFISITQSFNTMTAEGRLMLRMMMLLAEYERELIVTRTKDKLNYYKEQLKKKGFFIKKDGTKCYSLGRPTGSSDKKRRKLGGYYLRYNK